MVDEVKGRRIYKTNLHILHTTHGIDEVRFYYAEKEQCMCLIIGTISACCDEGFFYKDPNQPNNKYYQYPKENSEIIDITVEVPSEENIVYSPVEVTNDMPASALEERDKIVTVLYSNGEAHRIVMRSFTQGSYYDTAVVANCYVQI